MDTPIKSVELSQSETRQQEMEVKKQLAKIYRLFSSKKYMKYKHQFPRMKETEIVNKIIKQWESMTKEQKLGLKEIYSKREMLDSESEESDFSGDMGKRSKVSKKVQQKEQNNKQETPDNKIQLEKKIKVEKHSKTKVYEASKLQHHQQSIDIPQKYVKQKKQQIQLQDLIYKSQQSEEQSDQQHQQSHQKQEQPNSQSIFPTNKNKNIQKILSKSKQTKSIKNKRKIIKKQKTLKKESNKKQINYSQLKNGQYLLFYKYYYKKLKNQHPKWSETQITFIIKLLWKKHSQKQKLNQQLSNKKSKIQSQKPTKPKRPISGKQYFTNQKLKINLTRQQINQLWKHLPRESKNDWNKRALQLNTQNISNIHKKQGSNVKSETTAKTQNRQRKQKTIVTFRDLLLKGRIMRPINQHILEQNKESSFPEPISQQKALKQHSLQKKQQHETNKLQDVQYVSLQSNPFSFMMKKIDNKILLE